MQKADFQQRVEALVPGVVVVLDDYLKPGNYSADMYMNGRWVHVDFIYGKFLVTDLTPPKGVGSGYGEGCDTVFEGVDAVEKTLEEVARILSAPLAVTEVSLSAIGVL